MAAGNRMLYKNSIELKLCLDPSVAVNYLPTSLQLLVFV